MDQDSYQQAAEWRLRRVKGLSPAEEMRFRTWRSTAANAEAYAQVVRSWNAFESAEHPAIASIRARALARRGRSRRSLFGRAAAAIAILAILAGGYGVLSPRLGQTTYAAETDGMIRDIILDDGTQLTLDSGAVIKTRIQKDRREIVLVEGRVRFAVAHDPARPMHVDVGQGVVTVLGTTFNIAKHDDDAVVTLVEGSIAVSQKAIWPRIANSEPTALKPGEQLALRASGPGPVQVVDTAQASIWHERKLEFSNVALEQAVARVNRYADTPIVIGDRSLAALRISGRFDHGDASGFAEGVGKLYDLETAIADGRIILRRSGRKN